MANSKLQPPKFGRGKPIPADDLNKATAQYLVRIVPGKGIQIHEGKQQLVISVNESALRKLLQNTTFFRVKSVVNNQIICRQWNPTARTEGAENVSVALPHAFRTTTSDGSDIQPPPPNTNPPNNPYHYYLPQGAVDGTFTFQYDFLGTGGFVMRRQALALNVEGLDPDDPYVHERVFPSYFYNEVIRGLPGNTGMTGVDGKQITYEDANTAGRCWMPEAMLNLYYPLVP